MSRYRRYKGITSQQSIDAFKRVVKIDKEMEDFEVIDYGLLAAQVRDIATNLGLTDDAKRIQAAIDVFGDGINTLTDVIYDFQEKLGRREYVD